MAKDTKTKQPDENGAATASPTGPQLNILAQYVKDLSFENPNAPGSLRPRETAPEISININVNPKPLSETDVEVELKLEAQAKADNEMLFNVELIYSGVVRITGATQEQMQGAVLIEVPRLIFPFARQILAEATRNGGFPPLMVDPVDFAQLFRQKLAEQGTANA